MAYSSTMSIDKEASLLTTSEAAEFLHVHANTLQRWSDIGLLVTYRISSRGDRRFFREDLIHFLSEYNMYKENSLKMIESNHN